MTSGNDSAVVAGVRVDTRHWIDGRRVASERSFTRSHRRGVLIGRGGGTWSLDFYCDLKNTCSAPAGWTKAEPVWTRSPQ